MSVQTEYKNEDVNIQVKPKENSSTISSYSNYRYLPLPHTRLIHQSSGSTYIENNGVMTNVSHISDPKRETQCFKIDCSIDENEPVCSIDNVNESIEITSMDPKENTKLNERTCILDEDKSISIIDEPLHLEYQDSSQLIQTTENPCLLKDVVSIYFYVSILLLLFDKKSTLLIQ